MRTLKEYINEGLLKGQKATIDDGDNFVDVLAEFESLKKLCTDLKNYGKMYAGRLYVAKMEIPLLFEYAGIKDKDYNTILFQIIRYGDGVNWYCNASAVNPIRTFASKCLLIPGSSKMTKRPEQILKNAIEPLFIDFNAFVTWLSGQIKERNY
jgi:hypothetical protein